MHAGVGEMADANYLKWLARETPTAWRHDLAEPSGVTQKTLGQFVAGGWSLIEAFKD